MYPNASDLEYFQAVAREKSISKAALCVGISQPSVTLAMKRLESQLGVNLLIRSKKGVELTKSGLQLSLLCRQLFDKYDEILNSTRSQSLEIQGQVHIGVHPSVALFGLKKIMPKLLDENPLLEIKFTHDHSQKICQEIIDLKLDLGIVVNPIKHPDLYIKKLYDDQVMYFRGGKANSKNTIDSGNCILFADMDLIQSNKMQKKLKKERFSRVITSNSLENIRSLVEQGCGVGILPQTVAKESNSKLSALKGLPLFKDEIYLVMRHENLKVRSIKTVSDNVIQSLQAK